MESWRSWRLRRVVSSLSFWKEIVEWENEMFLFIYSPWYSLARVNRLRKKLVVYRIAHIMNWAEWDILYYTLSRDILIYDDMEKPKAKRVKSHIFKSFFFLSLFPLKHPLVPSPRFLLIHSELISRPRRHALFFLHISTCFVVDRCDSNDDWKFLRLLLEAPDYHYKSIYDETNMEHAAREATRFRWFALSWTWDEENLYSLTGCGSMSTVQTTYVDRLMRFFIVCSVSQILFETRRIH